MKRLSRRWKWVIAMVLLLPLVLAGVAQWIASAMLKPASLARRLEEKWNCRVQLKSASGSLWSSPARIEMAGLTLLPRDADADAAKPLEDRAPVDFNAAPHGLHIENASIGVSVWSLLLGDLDVHDFRMSAVTLRTNSSQDGANSLRQMLQRPATVAGKPNTASAGKGDKKQGTGKSPAEPAAPFNIRDLPLASALKVGRIEHIRIDFKSDKRKELLRLEDATITLDDVAVDPGNLSGANHAKFALTGTFQVLGKRRVEYANLGIKLEGDFNPFDPATGDLAALPVSLTFSEGSSLKEVAALQRISQKMKRWEKYGLKFKDLPSDAILKEGARLDFDFHQGKFTTRNDFAVNLDTYDVSLAKGASFNLNDDQCIMEIRVTASKAVSDQAVQDFQTSLREKYSAVGSVLYDSVMKLFREQNLVLPDGRVSVPMGLTGSIQKPEVEDRVTPLLEKALLQSLLPIPN